MLLREALFHLLDPSDSACPSSPPPNSYPAVPSADPKQQSRDSLQGGGRGCPSLGRQASPQAWKWKAQSGVPSTLATSSPWGSEAPRQPFGVGGGTLPDLRKWLPLGALAPLSLGGPERRAPLYSGLCGRDSEGKPEDQGCGRTCGSWGALPLRPPGAPSVKRKRELLTADVILTRFIN